MSENNSLYLVVPSNKNNDRVDRFVSETVEDLTRSRVQALIKAGLITINGDTCKPNSKVREGDKLAVFLPPPEITEAIPQDIPLNIVYEDRELIVINKPANMVVHPGIGNPDKTLVNALLHHCDDLSGVGGIERPGVVHRIDKDTSGLLVFSKTDTAHQALSIQFRNHTINRRYRCMVHGLLPSGQGTIESIYGRHPTDRKKFTSTRITRGKQAITHWRIQESFGGLITLLELKLETGRTHQIRVHMADAGYPVVGDQMYGSSPRKAKQSGDPYLQEILQPIKRQMLHAYRLGFRHPVTNEKLLFEVPDPKDFAHLLEQLRVKYNKVGI